MTTDRFSPFDLFRAHRKALRNRNYMAAGSSKVDLLAWLVLAVPPILLLAASIFWSWRVSDAQSMLAGVALIIGGGLAAFGQLASWRSRLTEREDEESIERPERDSIDEATAHLLWATWVAVFTTPFLVIAAETKGDGFQSGWTAWIPRLVSGLSFSLGLYLLLLLGMVLPKLYDAYAAANRLAPEMDGRAKN